MAEAPLHLMTHRKAFASLTQPQRARLRHLLDLYITTENPNADHAAAQQPPLDMKLMIHGSGFLAWHMVFLGKLENWLAVRGATEFIPLPYWDPATPIPEELDLNNTPPNKPLPAKLHPKAIEKISPATRN